MGPWSLRDFRAGSRVYRILSTQLMLKLHALDAACSGDRGCYSLSVFAVISSKGGV